jgi:NADH-quinone oxidoreductase subunit I
MAVDERDVRQAPEVEPKSTGLGLLKGLSVTLKHALRPSITQQYPQEKPDLPPRTRGVIALKEANCTVCYKCSRECPDWCIYIDAHKETHEPASGGKGRSMKVLDRFAIDYALCMYCGICVEVCPFDALFWSPEFEYSEYDIVELTHEKEKLEEWTYAVLPPPMIEEGAEVEQPAVAPEPSVVAPDTTGLAAAYAAAPSAGPAPAAASPAAAPPLVAAPAAAAPAAAAPAAAAAAAEAPAPVEHAEVTVDQETYERVLAELLEQGTDRRVAEGRAKRAGMVAARAKAEGGS